MVKMKFNTGFQFLIKKNKLKQAQFRLFKIVLNLLCLFMEIQAIVLKKNIEGKNILKELLK